MNNSTNNKHIIIFYSYGKVYNKSSDWVFLGRTNESK